MKYKIMLLFVIYLGFNSFYLFADVEFQLSQFVNNGVSKVTVLNNSKNVIKGSENGILSNKFELLKGEMFALNDFKLPDYPDYNCFLSTESCSYEISKINSSSVRIITQKMIDPNGHYAESVVEFNFGNKTRKVFLALEINKDHLRVYEVDFGILNVKNFDFTKILEPKKNGLSFSCFVPTYFYKE